MSGLKVPWGERRWNRVAVYGLGLSGRAATSFLRSRGVEVLGLDRRPKEALDLGPLESDPGLELCLGEEPRELPEGIDAVVLSPGVPTDRPLLKAARNAGLAVVAEVELAMPFLQGEVIAITGSNGKSTTTALTAALLRQAGRSAEACGNIGQPLSAFLDGRPVDDTDPVYVVELSSFQLESTDRFHPRVAALLNLSADHLDRHGSMEAYLAIKAAIFAHQTPEDVAILNADDDRVASLRTRSRRRLFSRRQEVVDGCFLSRDRVLEASPGSSPRELFHISDLPLPGHHNQENAMAAALMARGLGVEPAEIAAGLRAFHGLPHRLEKVRERGGVVFYDDSKGTNIGATARSLEGFEDHSVHLILGGRNKGADPQLLVPVVTQKARRVYLIGESAEDFELALAAGTASLDPVPMEQCDTLDRAVLRAARQARPGEMVVLSPACASFDQFANYIARGQEFQRLVKALDGVANG